MVRKLVVGTLTLALFALNSSAQFYPQNARIEALGGAFIVDDPSDILRYSAYINTYTDDAQITFRSSTDSNALKYSPIWGVKSIGEKFNIGVLANRGRMLTDNFYTTSTNRLRTDLSISAASVNGIPADQNIPHLLLGVNAGSILIGADFFFEYSRFHQTIDNAPTPGTETKTNISATEYNPGGILSVNFGTKEVPISGKFGIGFPRVSGLRDESGSPKIEITSKKGLFLDLGAEIGFPLFKWNWTAGSEFRFDTYQFQRNDTATTGKYSNFEWAMYAGFETPILDDGLIVFQYDLRLLNSKRRAIVEGYAPANRDSSDNTIEHVFSAGVEKPWLKAGIFDKFIARLGLDYTISTPISHINGDDSSGEYKEKTKDEADFNQFVPHIGFGITKSVFALDLNVNPTAWAGLVSGPAVGTVTATVIF
jgi:hypothetical protein